METMKKIFIGFIALGIVLSAFFILPKEERLSANVRIATSNDSSGLLLDYIVKSNKADGKIKDLDVESYIIGDC